MAFSIALAWRLASVVLAATGLQVGGKGIPFLFAVGSGRDIPDHGPNALLCNSGFCSGGIIKNAASEMKGCRMAEEIRAIASSPTGQRFEIMNSQRID
jgi:hypothetical protein